MNDQKLCSHAVLSLAGAEALLSDGIAEAGRRKLNLAFAVVDSAGHLVAFQRMDEASLVTIETAQGKARTAALVKGPSARFSQMIDDGRASMLSMPGLVSIRGGIPVVVEGQVVGAVGVSGATGEIDEEVAEAIVDRFTG